MVVHVSKGMARWKSTLKKYDKNQIKILQEYGPLMLIEEKIADEKSDAITYLIIYQRFNDKAANLLWQSENEKECRNRFSYLQSIVSACLTMYYLNRPKSLKFLEDVINVMKDHPNWNDVLIAADLGLLEFFRKRNFTSRDINVQFAPDFHTPLHRAVIQQYRLTTEKILQFNPNLSLVDDRKNSVVHVAALSHIEIFKLILSQPSAFNLLRAENIFIRNPVELICINAKKEHLIHLLRIGSTARLLTIVNQEDRDLLLKVDDQTIIKFNDNEINSIDFSKIDSGGCPLHWSIKADFTRKFIGYFNLETPNLKKETPLIVMVKDEQFHCALSLMIHGADVNKLDGEGNSALHLAVEAAHYLMVKSLIIFDSDVTILNSEGLDPYQLAQKTNEDDKRSNCQEIVQLFEEYHEAKSYKLNNQMPQGNSLFHQYYQHVFIKTKTKTDFKDVDDDDRGNDSDGPTLKSRLISLDGGGVKGLFTVQMMIELQKYLNKELISYFDWIAGTSTGSMIAFALTQNRTLHELRKLYFVFKDEILKGNRPYSTQKVESLFKSQLGGETPLKNVFNLQKKHLIITATRVDHYTPTLQLFCSHGFSPNLIQAEWPPDMPTWHALRASCAAPTYFHHFCPFIDGGLVSNNPTLDSIVEFFRHQETLQRENLSRTNSSLKKENHISKLQTVLSIGTGHCPAASKNFSYAFDKFNYFMDFRSFIRDLNSSPWTFGNELLSQMKTQVTNCNDHVVNRAASWCSCLNVPYFRINAIISKKVSLDETRDEELIPALWDVKIYCIRMSDYFKKIAQVLEKD